MITYGCGKLSPGQQGTPCWCLWSSSEPCVWVSHILSFWGCCLTLFHLSSSSPTFMMDFVRRTGQLRLVIPRRVGRKAYLFHDISKLGFILKQKQASQFSTREDGAPASGAIAHECSHSKPCGPQLWGTCQSRARPKTLGLGHCLTPNQTMSVATVKHCQDSLNSNNTPPTLQK